MANRLRALVVVLLVAVLGIVLLDVPTAAYRPGEHMRSSISAVGYSWEPWRRLRLKLANGFGAGPNDLVMGEYNLTAAVIYGDRFFLRNYSSAVRPDVLLQAMEVACEVGPDSLPGLVVESVEEWPAGVADECTNGG